MILWKLASRHVAEGGRRRLRWWRGGPGSQSQTLEVVPTMRLSGRCAQGSLTLVGDLPDIPDRVLEIGAGEAFMAMEVMARYSLPATDRVGNAHGVDVLKRRGPADRVEISIVHADG